jgi:hypothetical protein
MSGRILRTAVAVALWSGVHVGVLNTALAENCLTAPNSSAPQGSYWYYYVDRTNQRKCWYLRASGRPAQRATTQAAPEAALAVQSHPTPAPSGSTPKTRSAGPPISLGNATPTSRQVKKLAVKPKPGPVASARTDNVVQKSGQGGNTGPLPLETSAPQSSLSAQTTASGDGSTPARPAALPDTPPAIATVKPQERSAVPTVPLKADALASNDAERTTQTGTDGWLRPTPKIYLICALGLAVIGAVSRILMIAAAHGPRVFWNFPNSDWVAKSTAGESGATSGSSRASSMNGENTTHLYRAQEIAARANHSELTTSDRDNARDKHEIINEDDRLAQMNQELAAIAEGRASWWPRTPSHNSFGRMR